MMPIFTIAKILNPTPAQHFQLIEMLRLPEVTIDEQKLNQVQNLDGDWQGWLAQSKEKNSSFCGYAHVKGYRAVEQRWALEIIPSPDLNSQESQALRSEMLTQVITDLRAQMLEEHSRDLVLYYWQHNLTEAPFIPEGFEVKRELARMTKKIIPVNENLSKRENADKAKQESKIQIASFNGSEAHKKGVLNVNNAAFLTHPEQGNWTMETLEERLAQTWFSNADLLLAVNPEVSNEVETIVGYHWTKPVTIDDRPGGEVYVIGVHPNAQGKGIGNLLMEAGTAHMINAFKAEAIDLYVDLAETIPVALYKKMGFTIATTSVCLATTLQA